MTIDQAKHKFQELERQISATFGILNLFGVFLVDGRWYIRIVGGKPSNAISHDLLWGLTRECLGSGIAADVAAIEILPASPAVVPTQRRSAFVMP